MLPSHQSSQLLCTMAASSLLLPLVSPNHQLSLDSSSLKSSSSFCFGGLKHGFRRPNLDKSKVSMSVSVGYTTAIDDALFTDYKPTTAFLFPGQGAQAVGMGREALKVPAAAELYSKANEVLGFDILDVCINGPKEKLDSTVLTQASFYCISIMLCLLNSGDESSGLGNGSVCSFF
ncbi:putative Acyl transferase domain superfamily, Acyl transferase/acyl hydrolase/lysophospholipase [Helianthus anomalus]